jgi:hypothetical protein
MRRLFALAGFLAILVLAASPAAASSGYNGAAAAQYADTYWSTYNSAYPSFANKGGDCTNFVSQALYAGGIAQRPSPPNSGDAAWYMVKTSRKSWSYSLSWINVMHNENFLFTLPGVTKVADVTGAAPGQTVSDNATQGDVVLYDWNNDGTFDHEAIVTASDGTVNGATNWDLVDAHTNNRYHAYWTLAQYNTSWATTHIVVIHIPAGTS